MKRILKEQEKQFKRNFKNQKTINQQLQQLEENKISHQIKQDIQQEKQYKQYIDNRKQFIDYALTQGFYNTANDLLKNDQGQIISDIINNRITAQKVITIMQTALNWQIIKPIQADVLTEKINYL